MIEKMYRRKEKGDFTAEKGLSSHDDYPANITRELDKERYRINSYDVAIILINFNSSEYTIKCITLSNQPSLKHYVFASSSLITRQRLRIFKNWRTASLIFILITPYSYTVARLTWGFLQVI